MPQEPSIRNLIKAPPGKVIMEQDYSQLELRIVCALSKEPNMMQAYHAGKDLHGLTMELMFPEIDFDKEEAHIVKRYRTYAKATNFGFVYGLQARSFVDYAKSYGLNLSLEEAEDFRNRFLNAYSALPVWWKQMIKQASTYGYAKTLTNRKRFLPDIWSDNFKDRSASERQAINTPVQGLGSDICISALSDIVFSTELDHSRFRVIGSVHDAILYEVNEDYAEELSVKTSKIMEYPSLLRDLEVDLGVPLVVDTEISHAWGGH